MWQRLRVHLLAPWYRWVWARRLRLERAADQHRKEQLADHLADSMDGEPKCGSLHWWDTQRCYVYCCKAPGHLHGDHLGIVYRDGEPKGFTKWANERIEVA